MAARLDLHVAVALLLVTATTGLGLAAKIVPAFPSPCATRSRASLQRTPPAISAAIGSSTPPAPSAETTEAGSLSDYIEGLSPADFPAAFDVLKATSGADGSDSALRRLLERWTAAAPLEAASAWSSLPAGRMRADLLHGLVQHLPASAGLAWARSALRGEEREIVTAALGPVLADSDPAAALVHASEEQESHLNSAMLYAVALRMIEREPTAAVREIARLPSSGPREVLLLQAISALGRVRPAHASTAALDTLASDELRREALKRILPAWRRVASAELDAWLKTRTKPRDQGDFAAVFADLAGG